MGNNYNSIKTASELVSVVQMHGLSLDQESLNRVADIFGNSTVEELVRLANDIGRNNEHGEPDPKGTWSSDRKATQGTFYSIISHIWNWEEVTRFWNEHTNPEREELTELREANRKLNEELSLSTVQKNKEHEMRLAETSEKLDAKATADRLAAELHDKEMEVIELKAKLYDLMVKEGK